MNGGNWRPALPVSWGYATLNGQLRFVEDVGEDDPHNRNGKAMFEKASILVQIHSVPKGQRARLEWELARVLNRPVALRWRAQLAIRDALCGTYECSAGPGTAAIVASALFGWRDLRFDIYEAASAGNDGVRFSHTPRLGLFRAQIDASGATVVPEDRLRVAVEAAGSDLTALQASIDDVLGTSWDLELEPFREMHLDGAPAQDAIA